MPQNNPTPLDGNANKGQRIAKLIARSGLCSRRDAEKWIAEGRVEVDGVVLDSPAFTVQGHEAIKVDGKPLEAAEKPRLWLYHKPVDLLTTHYDPQGRATVFDALPKEIGRVVSVGRLDINSEGLLLLTNDGEISRYCELPATGWERTYRLRLFGAVTRDDIKKLAGGITIDGVEYGEIRITPEDSHRGKNQWVTAQLNEGKNRELRKVFDHLGHPVNRLIRTHYGPFALGDLEPGELKEVSQTQLRDVFPAEFLE